MPIPKVWVHDNEVIFMNEWKGRMAKQGCGTAGPPLKDTKVVVTKYSLDKWVAEGAGLDLENFPLTKSKANENAEQVWLLLREYLKSRDENANKEL